MAMNREQYYDERETMPQTEREAYQRRKLLETMEQVYRRSNTARNLMDFVAISPSEFDSLDALERLPITRKNDLI